MYKYTEDFILIYFHKVKIVDYGELTDFLDLTFHELLDICNSIEEMGLLTFSEGRFRTSVKGLEQLKKYNLDAFDFSEGINLKDPVERYRFKDIDYIPPNKFSI